MHQRTNQTTEVVGNVHVNFQRTCSLENDQITDDNNDKANTSERQRILPSTKQKNATQICLSFKVEVMSMTLQQLSDSIGTKICTFSRQNKCRCLPSNVSSPSDISSSSEQMFNTFTSISVTAIQNYDMADAPELWTEV